MKVKATNKPKFDQLSSLRTQWLLKLLKLSLCHFRLRLKNFGSPTSHSEIGRPKKPLKFRLTIIWRIYSTVFGSISVGLLREYATVLACSPAKTNSTWLSVGDADLKPWSTNQPIKLHHLWKKKKTLNKMFVTPTKKIIFDVYLDTHRTGVTSITMF